MTKCINYFTQRFKASISIAKLTASNSYRCRPTERCSLFSTRAVSPSRRRKLSDRPSVISRLGYLENNFTKYHLTVSLVVQCIAPTSATIVNMLGQTGL